MCAHACTYTHMYTHDKHVWWPFAIFNCVLRLPLPTCPLPKSWVGGGMVMWGEPTHVCTHMHMHMNVHIHTCTHMINMSGGHLQFLNCVLRLPLPTCPLPKGWGGPKSVKMQ